MSFSYSSGVITQTGTDTDLTGLSGLTGVTTQVSGSGLAQHTTYFLNSSTRLQIDGTLSFDPSDEKVSISFPVATSGSSPHPLTISGSLTVEGSKTANGRTQYSRMTGIDLTATSSVWWRDHGIEVTSTGSFTMNGGALRLGSGIRGNATSTIFFQNCVIYASASNSGTVFRAGDNSPVLRNVEIASRVNSEVFISAKQGFSEASLILRNAMYYTETAQSTTVTFTDYDVSSNIASADVNFENQYAMGQVIFNNTSNRLRVRQQSPNRGGYAKCFKTFNVPVQDLDGNSIDYSYYGKDFNNGNRLVSFLNAFDDTADKVYSGTNQSGNFTDSILWEILNPIQQTINIDDRTDSNDRIPISFVSYLHNITEYAPELVGLGTESNPLKLTPDLFITETNRTTVDAYTEIDTPEKFYDRLKSYLVSNFVGQALYASRSGNLIDAGSYDVTIDATASAALSITGNLITIKASTFTGNINATGTFTLSNGAVLDGVLNGVLNVSNGDVLTEDIDGTFVVNTNSVTSFTIDGFIPTNIQTTGTGSATILGINNAKLTTTNITGTGTLVRGDGLNPSANWSVASNTLTLSGTEGDLLGLRGLAEVDYADAGGKTVYTVNSLTKIVIDSTGDLTIDSDVEQLVCGVTPASHVNTLTVNGSGRLQVGKAKVVGGFTIYSSGPAIVFNNDSSSAAFTVSDSWANLELHNGSRLDWYGGEIQSVGLLLPKPGSQFRTYSKEAMFVSVPSKLQTSRPEAYIRMQTSDQIIDGFVNKFGILLMIGKPTSFSGYEPISSGSAIDMSNQSTSSSFYDFADLVAGKGNTRDVGGKSNTWVRLLNTNLGSDITVTAQNSSESNSQTYLVESRKGIIFNFADENGTAIQGAKLHMVDTDHGSRLAANQVGSNASYAADKVYTGTSNASGVIDFSALADSILLSLHYSTNSSGNPIYDIFDSRGNNNNTTDLFTFKSMSYLQTIGSVTLELKGLGSLTQSQVLITDFSITETNRATVQAYALLNTAQQVYDFAKSYLYDNYSGELATIIGRSGNQVELAGKTLVINATASAVFAYSNPTITIKASTYTGGATATTGAVTTQNGALLNGGTFDCDVNYQSGANTTITGVTVNGTLDFNTAGTYTLDACTVSQVTNSSGGTVNISLANSATITTNTGPNINIEQVVTIAAASIIDGSRVQLYNVTKAAELDNSLVSGGAGYSFDVNLLGSTADSGDVIRIRATYAVGAVAKKEATATGVLSASGLSFLLTQSDDTTYNTLAINGSGVTGFSADYVDDEVDITVTTNFSLASLYAWWTYNTTTAQGIRDFFGGVVAEDVANFKINNSVVDIFLDNTTSTEVFATDNRRLYRADGARPVKNPTTGGGGVDVEWREKVLIANIDTVIDTNIVSVSSNSVGADGVLDVNVKEVNDVVIQGSGVPGDSMRPV